MRDKIRVVRGMVEDKSTQDEVLKSGKVDTIISEPIGVMLLHERMVRVSGRRVDVTLSPRLVSTDARSSPSSLPATRS